MPSPLNINRLDEVSPDDPVASVRAILAPGDSPRPVCGVRASGCHLCSSVSVYLYDCERRTGAVTSPLLVQLRGRFGGESEVIFSGTLSAFTDWSQTGSIAHAGGRLYDGFELWAASGESTNTTVTVRWHVAFNAPCAPYATGGTLV